MFCAIWYHLHNFKNLKNTYGGVLLLVYAFKIVQMVSHCAKYHQVDWALSIDGSKREWGVQDLISMPRIELKLGSVITVGKRRSFGSGKKVSFTDYISFLV